MSLLSQVAHRVSSAFTLRPEGRGSRVAALLHHRQPNRQPDPHDIPKVPAPILRRQDFAPPPAADKPPIQLQRAIHQPAGAKYRMPLPGLPMRDELFAYELPFEHVRRRYHECQRGEHCALPMLNTLAMALRDNDFAVLSGQSELQEFLCSRHGTARGSHCSMEDLCDFHNHRRASDPVLDFASATVGADGAVAGLTAAQAAHIDRAPSVGMSFFCTENGRMVEHGAVIVRNHQKMYAMLDCSRPGAYLEWADSMTQAVGAFMQRQPGLRPDGFQLLYPSPAAPAPMSPPSPVVWF